MYGCVYGMYVCMYVCMYVGLIHLQEQHIEIFEDAAEWWLPIV
jgi:hypothetical protein